MRRCRRNDQSSAGLSNSTSPPRASLMKAKQRNVAAGGRVTMQKMGGRKNKSRKRAETQPNRIVDQDQRGRAWGG